MTYLDTRDLDAELTELEGRVLDYEEMAAEMAADPDLNDAQTAEGIAEIALTDDERERLAALRDLRDEIGAEWSYGVTMIPEGDFEDYAQQLAEDIGAVPRDYAWPASHIDWAAAADALRIDYSTTTFEGEDYFFRA